MTATTMKSDACGTVLITGAARRIGRALALDMGQRGWKVCVHYRSSRGEADDLVETIVSSGGVAAAVGGDLSVADDVDKLIPACVDVLGAPTCLINNASEFQKDAAEDVGLELWSRHLDINLRAPVFLARSLFRNLPDGAVGNVINIIDQRVWRLTPEFFSYTISKAGLWAATQMLAQAMAPRVRVNAIGPGPVLPSIHQTATDFAAESSNTLLGRGPAPEEIAEAVHFILNAGAMTGQMIALDGGQHLVWGDGVGHMSVSADGKG